MSDRFRDDLREKVVRCSGGHHIEFIVYKLYKYVYNFQKLWEMNIVNLFINYI